MIAYKLTTQALTTHNNFKWEIGKRYEITKPGSKLCSDEVFHAYSSAELAVVLNPIHAAIKDPRIFEIECDVVVDDGLKLGSKHMILTREIELPVVTPDQLLKFAVLCADSVKHLRRPLLVYDTWADRFLATGATDGAKMAELAASGAPMAAARTAVWTTRVAEWGVAEWEVEAAVEAAIWTARAAEWTAEAAARAEAADKIDLSAILKLALIQKG